MIDQGDVYWIDLGESGRSEPGYRYPCVVIQNAKSMNSGRPSVAASPLTFLRLARSMAIENCNVGLSSLCEGVISSVLRFLVIFISRFLFKRDKILRAFILPNLSFAKQN